MWVDNTVESALMNGPDQPPPLPTVTAQEASLVTWTQFIYGLHAFSLLTGIIGAATVVGAFLTGWPSIIAVILNYVKRGEVRGTWLESHFRWQIRTFWFGLLWVSLCVLFIVATLGIGLVIAWLPLAVISVWFVYRIVKGWMALSDRRPMYTG
jgi:uncharacterized membrane protein